MWELHRTLQAGLVDNDQDLLVDTVSTMLDKISSNEFIQSLHILFKNFSTKNPGEMIVMLIAGLKKNNFFEFSAQIKEIANGRSNRG